MAKMSEYAFVAAILMTGLALVLYLLYAVSGLRAARMATAGGPGTTGPVGSSPGPRTAAIGRYATILAWLATLRPAGEPRLPGRSSPATVRSPTCTSSRWRSPSGSSSPTSGSSASTTSASWRSSRCRSPWRMLLYAATIPADIEPLVPALQNNLLLTVHVATAIVAYGSFAIAFAASYLFLLQTRHALAIGITSIAGVGAAAFGMITGGATPAAFVYFMAAVGVVAPRHGDRGPGHEARRSCSRRGSSGRWGLPKPLVLDEIGYRAVVVGFPFLTLTIILGAVWADIAWGSYWSWDPKETASLVTWFIYGAYLHARVMRGWRGNKAAWLLVIGFVATLLTYFGNLIFGGLHSYSGLG